MPGPWYFLVGVYQGRGYIWKVHPPMESTPHWKVHHLRRYTPRRYRSSTVNLNIVNSKFIDTDFDWLIFPTTTCGDPWRPPAETHRDHPQRPAETTCRDPWRPPTETHRNHPQRPMETTHGDPWRPVETHRDHPQRHNYPVLTSLAVKMSNSLSSLIYFIEIRPVLASPTLKLLTQNLY